MLVVVMTIRSKFGRESVIKYKPSVLLLFNLDHPGCVWSVCVNKSNGDIITGCIDGKIRVFTSNPQRKASPQEIEDYDKEVELAAA